jgi:hypothetical protein
LRHAEEILEIAIRGDEPVAILIDRRGGIRMVDPAGWSLPSLLQEYGSGYVYKVDRHVGMLRVEGWDGNQRCLLQRPLPLWRPLAGLPGMPGLSSGLTGAIRHPLALGPAA